MYNKHYECYLYKCSGSNDLNEEPTSEDTSAWINYLGI